MGNSPFQLHRPASHIRSHVSLFAAVVAVLRIASPFVAILAEHPSPILTLWYSLWLQLLSRSSFLVIPRRLERPPDPLPPFTSLRFHPAARYQRLANKQLTLHSFFYASILLYAHSVLRLTKPKLFAIYCSPHTLTTEQSSVYLPSSPTPSLLPSTNISSTSLLLSLL